MLKKMFFLLIITSMMPIIAMEQKEQEQKFFKAIKDGNIDEVKKLIAAGINIDMQDEDGNTPIIAAVTKSPPDMNIIDVILNEIPNTILANKNNKNAEGLTSGDLLNKIIPIRNQYLLYEQMVLKPLNISTIKQILNNTTTKKFINSPNQNRNLLANAIKTKSDYVVGEIINRGADVNQVFRDGTTPLDIAHRVGITAIIKLLTDRGAKSSAEEFFDIVLTGKVDDIAEFIKNRKISIDVKGGKNRDTALILAIKNNKTDFVNKLLELGADIITQNVAGETALALAIQEKNVDLVKTLLSKSKKLEIDAVGNYDIIKSILELVPDPSSATREVKRSKDNDYKTRMLSSLEKAQAQYNLYKAISANEELPKIGSLITSNVTLQVPNENRNPFVLAFSKSNASDLIKLFMQKGENAVAAINFHLRNGKTPLIIAIEENVALQVIKTLLQEGASPILAGADSKTPLEVAIQKENKEVIDLLQEVIAGRITAPETPVITPLVDDKQLLSSLHNFMQSLQALQMNLGK